MSRKCKQKWNALERGVSESIGFILIFSLVVTGIGIVTLYGYPLLMKQQMGTDIRIMEKTFIVLQNDVKSLVYKNVPYKETSLKIAGGMLHAKDATETPQTLILYYNTSEEYTSFNPGELKFDADYGDTSIILENGAVITANRIQGGSAMLSDPRWFYDNQTGTFVISLIRFTTSGSSSRTGVGTIGLRLTDINQTILGIEPETGFIQYHPGDSDDDYSVAWDNYFEQVLGLTRFNPDNKYQLPKDTKQVVIKEYTIEVLSL